MEKDFFYPDRYLKNRNGITESENMLLGKSEILIAGCGGLGGYVAEALLRIGIRHMSILDSDMFETSNLNRQLFCTERNIGKSKAAEAVERLAEIDSFSVLKPVCVKLTSGNFRDVLCGYDLIVDAFDSPAGKIMLENSCEQLGIPLVHGAIGGWTGQVSTVFPGDGTLKKIYGNRSEGAENETGVLSLTALVTAGYQASETVKVLLGKPGILRRKLMQIDLSGNRTMIFGIL